MLVDVFQGGDRYACFILVSVEHAKVLLDTVEVQARDRLSIVVIQQDGEIGLCVPLHYTGWLNVTANDGPYDVEALQFFEGGLDSGLGQVCLRRLFAGHRGRDFGITGHWEVRLPQGGLESFVDLVVEELLRGFGDEAGELVADLLRVGAVVDLGGQELDPVILGLLELGRDDPLDRPDVLQLAGGADDGIQVKNVLGYM